MVQSASRFVCGVLVAVLVVLVAYAAWVSGREAFATGRVVDDCQYGDVDALEYPSDKDAKRLSRFHHESEDAFKQGVYKVLNKHMSSVNKRLCKLFLYHDKAAIHVSHAMAKQGSTELDAFLSDFYNKDTMSRYLKFQVCPKGSHYDVSGNNCMCPLGKTCGGSDGRKGTRAEVRRATDDAYTKTTEMRREYDASIAMDDDDASDTDVTETKQATAELVVENDPASPVFEVLGANDEPVGKLPKCYKDYVKTVPVDMVEGGEGAFLCKDKGVCMDNQMVGVLGGFLDLKGEALVGEINRRCGNNRVPVMQ